MPKKITKKIPVEKLSEKEILVEIEDSDDSSSEEEMEVSVPPPSKLTKPKKERTAKQLANDQRLREAAAKRKANKETPKLVKKDKKVEFSEPEPLEDPDDKPMTVKQMKAFMESQKEKHSIPIAENPKRKYTKRAKAQAPTPPPIQQPTPQKPQKPQIPIMMWA
jgi:hypothetical protein